MQVAGQLQGGGDSPLAKYGRKLSGGPVKAFDVKADFDADFKSGDASVPVLSIDALGIGVTGALDAKGMRTGKGTVRGNLKIRGSDLSGLLVALGQDGLARTLQSLELETRAQGTSTAVTLAPLALEATFAGEGIPDPPAKMTLDVADARMDLNEETLILDRLTLDRLTLRGLGLEMAGNVNVAGVPGTPAISGRLDVRPFDLRELAGRLDVKLPATAGAGTLTKVALSGRFAGSATGLDLDDLALRVDDSELTGEFKAAGTIENPAVRFDLNVDEIDLDRYMPPGPAQPPAKQEARRAGKGEGAKRGRAVATGFIGIPVDTNPRIGRGRNVERRQADRIERDAGESRPASERKGRCRENQRRVGRALPRPVFPETWRWTVNPEAPALTIDSSLQGIRVDPLLEDVTGGARVRGTGDVDAALSAEGGSVEAMKRSLDGRVGVTFSDGAIVGMNVGKHLQRWKHADKSKSVTLDYKEATEFFEADRQSRGEGRHRPAGRPEDRCAGLPSGGQGRAGGSARRHHRLRGAGDRRKRHGRVGRRNLLGD